MNIVTGMISPEMNWAPKLAWYSCSFSASKRACTSRWRPNTLTSEWPLNASSICPLSRPVCAHWAMNLRFDRLAIWRVTSITSGIVTRAIERQQRRDRHHHRDDADDRERRRQQLAERLLHALLDVVDVVGRPAEDLAARLAVEVAQRQAVQLGSRRRRAAAARRG